MYAIRSYYDTLYDIVVTDPLDQNLEYLSAAVTGNVIGVSNTSIPTQMNITFDEIPAGEQAVIELHARVITSYSIHYTKLYDFIPIITGSHTCTQNTSP